MAEKKPSNDGISPEELDSQEAADLPNREAMSLITPLPADWGSGGLGAPGTEPADVDRTVEYSEVPIHPEIPSTAV